MLIDAELELTLEAIRQAGSPNYCDHAGATLERLTALAKQGQLGDVSLAYWLHSLIHPRDRKTLDKLLPWKILWDFVVGFRKLRADKAHVWISRNPDWADQMRQVASHPRRLALMAEIIAAQVADTKDK